MAEREKKEGIMDRPAAGDGTRRHSLFFDLDGTLLGRSRKLHPETRRAILEAKSRGSRIFLCSGRTPVYLESGICRELPVDGMVACAGGVVKLGGEIIFENRLSEECLSLLLGGLREAGISYELDTALGVYESEGFMDGFTDAMRSIGALSSAQEEAFARERRHDLAWGIAHPLAAMPEDLGVQKVVFAGDRGRLEPLLASFEERYSINLFFRSETALGGEFIPRDCTKERGIEALLAFLGERREDTVGFGDSMNDLEMLRYVGTGVAFEGAPKALLEAADMTFSDPDEGGIAGALRALGLAVAGE